MRAILFREQGTGQTPNQPKDDELVNVNIVDPEVAAQPIELSELSIEDLRPVENKEDLELFTEVVSELRDLESDLAVDQLVEGVHHHQGGEHNVEYDHRVRYIWLRLGTQ